MDILKISKNVESQFDNIFEELRSGLSAREDSRAFGAMIEQQIADNWKSICENCGYKPLERPGRRTIFDFAFMIGETIVGIETSKNFIIFLQN